ncbi:MAG TPA: efflux RND transporter periplasmic adaptor subunit [Methylophilaceae bacterium]|jgi:Cu(I)/Ag(I) efflux system membrane fusion protein
MKRIQLVIIIIVVAVLSIAGVLGWQKLMQAPAKPDKSVSDKPRAENAVVQDNSGKTVKYWYDPMVPAQKFDRPGKSPFMDMQLEPKYADEATGGEQGGVSVPSQTVQNLGIRIEPAKMASFGESLSAVGRIEPDERRFYAVQTRIPGFVERLMVRAVGDPVAKGQKIAEVYAPDLLAAQQEYLALFKLDNVNDIDNLKQSARNRLKLLGMTEGEVAAITRSGTANLRFGIYAPASGVLTELGVREGAQLMPGSSMMQIADLSSLWLMAEVPERDATRLKIGGQAQVELQSLPGETFKGRISYFYPMLDEATRTLKVRVELNSQGGRLRPGMYANVQFDGQSHEGLAVPTEAVIATGTRKVVIVKQEHGFMPAEVMTGREGGGNTEILSGLKADENVVVSGQFLIDSEASLSGVLARLSQQAPDEHEMPEAKP